MPKLWRWWMVALLASAVRAQPSGGPDAPSFTARMHAGLTAAAPGDVVPLLIELDVEKRWHIYHPIILDTGFPTRVVFDAPAGVTFDPLRFPAPKLDELAGQFYLAHEDKVLLLTQMRLPQTLTPGTPLSVTAQVSALACIEACIPVRASATLELPIKATPGEPANADLFARAAKRLPLPWQSAPYVAGSRLVVSHTSLPIGGKGELIAEIRIQPQHHIWHKEPGNPDFIPTRLMIESADGIVFGDQVWSQPKLRQGPDGSLREHAGTLTIRVPFEVQDPDFDPGPVKLLALLRYQSCNEAGQCFPPVMAETSVQFDVLPAGQPAVANAAALTMSAAEAAAAVAPAGQSSPSAPPALASGASAQPAYSLGYLLLMAFVGGMILNVMPCVLPVISIKILSFVRQAGESRARTFHLGLIYGVGVLVSFAAIGVVMLGALGAAGVSAGFWGVWMQQPVYVIGMCVIVLMLALALLGVFELKLPGAVEGAAGQATSGEGPSGAFFNGLLAVALASACTAPVMGVALGALAALPGPVMFLGVMVIGLGMAFPYVLLSAFPQWLKLLPRPGTWMVVFKELMGFLMLATLMWLLWTLQFLVAVENFVATLVLLLGVGFACWLVGKAPLTAGWGRTILHYAGGLAGVAACWWLGFTYLNGGLPLHVIPDQTSGPVAEGDIRWEKWEPGLAERLAGDGHTVYVDFTAKWCLNCQTNKNQVLLVDPVRERLLRDRIVMVKADWTNQGEEIGQALRSFRRAGVPLNVIYPAGRPQDTIVLPELLTSNIVLSALNQAGPSKASEPIATNLP